MASGVAAFCLVTVNAWRPRVAAEFGIDCYPRAGEARAMWHMQKHTQCSAGGKVQVRATSCPLQGDADAQVMGPWQRSTHCCSKGENCE